METCNKGVNLKHETTNPFNALNAVNHNLIVVEGPDCSGKTSLCEAMSLYLTGLTGRKVINCAEPGTTELGKAIRKLVKSDIEMDAKSLVFMFYAAHNQLINEVMKPNLDAGNIVIVDRYLLSTVIYQTPIHKTIMEKELFTSFIYHLNNLCNAPVPGLQLILDIDFDAYIERRANRIGEEDRFEKDDLRSYMNAAIYIDRYNRMDCFGTVHIDATRSQNEVHGYVFDLLDNHFHVQKAAYQDEKTKIKSSKSSKRTNTK